MKVELVTTLKRQATTILADLNVSKKPVLITEHGNPATDLVDIEDDEFTQQQFKILEGIARGDSAIVEHRVLSQQQAKEKMNRWLAF
ncbi:MAG: type II toxin-antitoxin system prevent-host-death family antitoxin [Algicola sp.]|nr:type II toxin-antitoxin system prevent-host-death family antitoxin [Algicola sp.]